MTDSNSRVSRWWTAGLIATFALSTAYPYLRFLAGARQHRSAAVGFIIFDPLRLVFWAAVGIFIGWILYGIVKRFGRSPSRAAFTAVVSLFVVFTWQPFDVASHRLDEGSEALSSRAALIVVVAIAVLIVVLAWRIGTSPEFVSGAAAILAAMAVAAAFQFFWGEDVTGDAVVDVADIEIGRPLNPAPDVYLLVLDGYGSEAALEEFASFDNSGFVAEIEDLGLSVHPNAKSVYSYTVFSVASMFALEPPIRSGPFDSATRLAVQRDLMSGGPLAKAFSDAGYEVIHVENGWSILNCERSNRTCVRGSLANEYDWAFLQSTAIPDLLPAAEIHPWARGSVNQFEALGEIASEDSTRPRFVFAHILTPHPPFQMTPECELRSASELEGFRWGADDVDIEVRMAGFQDQIACVNLLTTEFLESVPEDAVVVITGDHGSDFRDQTRRRAETWTREDADERLSILLATRLPEACDEWQLADPVSAMRLVANCVLGSDYQPYEGWYSIVEYQPDGSGRVVSTDS